MNPMYRIRRLAGMLAALAVSMVAFAAASPAAFAVAVPAMSDAGAPRRPGHVHAIAAAGMAGWQIALIAVGASVVAAAAAVLADRARAARRHATAPAA